MKDIQAQLDVESEVRRRVEGLRDERCERERLIEAEAALRAIVMVAKTSQRLRDLVGLHSPEVQDRLWADPVSLVALLVAADRPGMRSEVIAMEFALRNLKEEF